MDLRIEYEDRRDYLKVTVAGTNSREAVMAYFADLREECLRRHRSRVLIEERLDGPRLDVMDVFTIASEGSINALGEFDAIAYVDSRMGSMAEFAETVAVNRGMPVAIFNNVDDAERWLLEQKSGVGQQDIFIGQPKKGDS
jgi:hypothetical protein